MSRCYSRHSSSTCSSFPAVASFVLYIHFPARSRPRARHRSASHLFLSRRKIMLLPPTSVHPRGPHKGIISNVLHVVMDERKKEVTTTFRPVPQTGDKKRCPTINVPESRVETQYRGWASTVTWVECYRDFSSATVCAFSVLLKIRQPRVYTRRAFMFSFLEFANGGVRALVYLTTCQVVIRRVYIILRINNNSSYVGTRYLKQRLKLI